LSSELTHSRGYRRTAAQPIELIKQAAASQGATWFRDILVGPIL